MFVPDFNKSIPGYTGHRQTALDEAEDVQQHKEPRKQIPGKYWKLQSLKPIIGYGGYVPGVKSENVYGQTYGKTSYASSAKSFVRGMEEPAHLKYNTSMKMEFVDHAQRSHLIETTAQIVGVERGDSVYQKVSYNLIISHHFFLLFSQSQLLKCMLSTDQRFQETSRTRWWTLQRLKPSTRLCSKPVAMLPNSRMTAKPAMPSSALTRRGLIRLCSNSVSQSQATAEWIEECKLIMSLVWLMPRPEEWQRRV